MESLRRAIDERGIGRVKLRKLLRAQYYYAQRLVVNPEMMTAEQIIVLSRALGVSPEQLFADIVAYRSRRSRS